MEMTSLIIVGVVAIITIIGILSRYRKCKSDELLVVYGTAGQFMANMAKNLAPSLEIARNLPIADSLKQIITGKKPEESPAKGDNFPPVK